MNKGIREDFTQETDYKISVLMADFNFKQLEQEKEIIKLRNVELKKKSEELELSYNNISTISFIGQKITSTIKIEEVLDAVYEGVNSMMKADVFGIALIDKSTEEIDYKFVIENSIRIFPPRISIHTKNSLAAKCIRTNKEIKIDDTKEEIKNSTQIYQTDNPDDLLSLLYIPLIVERETIGVLTVQSCKRNQYNEYHLDMLKALGVFIASALNNSINHEKVNRLNDQLTKEKKELAVAKGYCWW